eukprot:superscaffoldBa00002205_g13535
MVERFVGTWKMISSENFDDYMKAIGRKRRVTVVTLENGKLVQKQSWDGKETNIEREVTDGKMVADLYDTYADPISVSKGNQTAGQKDVSSGPTEQ